MSVKWSLTSRPVRGDWLFFKILAGSIFSSCSFKSSANFTGASVFRIGISPSLTASSPLNTAVLMQKGLHIDRELIGCPCSAVRGQINAL